LIIGPLDLGAPSNPWSLPVVGQTTGTIVIEGYETAVYPRGSIVRSQAVTFYVKPWQAIGGFAANTQGAAKYLLKQLEELASNRDMQPTLIQWNATADPGASLNAIEAHDGWYVINSFEPDYANFVVSALVKCHMTVTEIAPAAPRSVALGYIGGPLTSNFSGAATNLLAVPVGSVGFESSFTRTGAEGTFSLMLSPLAQPEPIVLSSTLANIFKGGVHVYDTINTGANPVPVAGGIFVHANWVEVFYSDHNFVGDCVITNGLQLLLFQVATQAICGCYLWNTATATANWQQYGTLKHYDNSVTLGFLRSYSLARVGPEEVALRAISINTGGMALHTIRLQRGRYEVRVDLRPLNYTNTGQYAVDLGLVSAYKIVYNSGAIADSATAGGDLSTQTDYGYAAGFINSTSLPFVAGMLWQNQPSTQPHDLTGTVDLPISDTTGPVINAQRSYGFFAIPYGVSGSYSTANLQGDAENFNQKDAGWSAVVDGAASGGNTAKCIATTVAGHNLFDNGAGRSFTPAPGTYDVWVRIKVTSAAGVTPEMQVGLFDSTAGSYTVSTTYRANQVGIGYAWYRAGTGFTPTASHVMLFAAGAAATLGTDWFIDEFALVPIQMGLGFHDWPRDIWQQFAYDRSVRMVRP
jgi:hypothetical protein